MFEEDDTFEDDLDGYGVLGSSDLYASAPSVDPFAPPPIEVQQAPPAPAAPGPAPPIPNATSAAPFQAALPPMAPAPAPMAPVLAPSGGLVAAPTEPTAHLLGLSTVAVGVGGLVGARSAGVMGSISGALFGGAFVNLYRAVRFMRLSTPDAQREALASGTWALVAAGLGGYVAYKAGAATPNRSRKTRSTARSNASRSCGFRPVGP